MDHFSYRNRVLHCDDVSIPALAEKYGTPLYVYSKKTLQHHLDQLKTAFKAVDPLICYSIKTNGNLHIAKLMVEGGAEIGAGPACAGVSRRGRFLDAETRHFQHLMENGPTCAVFAT